MISLFEGGNHKNLMFNEFSSGKMIPANQHVLLHDKEALILDPGGHKVHTRLFAAMSSVLPINQVKHIFFSHQDPDIVAAANAWLMMTDAKAYLPEIWSGFVAHFGVDEMAAKRVQTIPDRGLIITVGGAEFKILPAHYLHSSGNFHLYDPISKILYSGDLGASPAAPYPVVEDFEAHIKYMENFHCRYMPTTKALKMWVNMINTLDIDIIAPQHGAVFKTKPMVQRFIEWIAGLSVGADLLGEAYQIPA